MLRFWLLQLALIVAMPCLQAVRINNHIIKTQTFKSPSFPLKPGSVAEKFYYNLNFPTGHIAIKSFDVEVVDEAGNPVTLFETYLHHWAIIRYYQHRDAADPRTNTSFTELHEPDYIIAGNSGICQNNSFPQYYGTGSDSRKTSTFLPNPYGIEVGNPTQVPPGYEERWCLNVHAIDTRGAENKLGCMECWCDLYNVTNDQHGLPLNPNYKGGLKCCYDKTQCRLSRGYEGEERSLYMRYIVKWVDWDDFVIPLKVYILDVTDTWKLLTDSTRTSQGHQCHVEYDAEPCSPTNKLDDECSARKKIRVIFPDAGYVVYGMAHQHIGAVGATLYGEDGRVLCSSSPIYGKGHEVGNEKGFVVGMSTCYPQPGSIKINNGEIVTFESNYNPTQNHIGVMSLFHIMVADKIPSLHMEASRSVGETSV